MTRQPCQDANDLHVVVNDLCRPSLVHGDLCVESLERSRIRCEKMRDHLHQRPCYVHARTRVVFQDQPPPGFTAFALTAVRLSCQRVRSNRNLSNFEKARLSSGSVRDGLRCNNRTRHRGGQSGVMSTRAV